MFPFRGATVPLHRPRRPSLLSSCEIGDERFEVNARRVSMTPGDSETDESPVLEEPDIFSSEMESSESSSEEKEGPEITSSLMPLFQRKERPVIDTSLPEQEEEPAAGIGEVETPHPQLELVAPLNLADPSRRYSVIGCMAHKEVMKQQRRSRKGVLRVLQDDAAFDANVIFPTTKPDLMLVDRHPSTCRDRQMAVRARSEETLFRRMSLPARMGTERRWSVASLSESEASE
ncbi:hypothetical protein J8273_4872 [Carpediemonas membranifera]|uniref:Uncharacterized protein n=1 Tax=Carpediemonas membranifera TaxID=201153 RepID=A0A8J6B1L9_9EUKA|nr:hypothetical protein J8273_4872 [Carpediemonas membranifera]|eukprot:KAG9393753.1 hypothetical protein J8273_4872 [Carpediemonas membranifera]